MLWISIEPYPCDVFFVHSLKFILFVRKFLFTLRPSLEKNLRHFHFLKSGQNKLIDILLVHTKLSLRSR